MIKSVHYQLFLKKITTPFFLLKNGPGATSAETGKNESSESKNNKTVEVEDSDLWGVQSET